MGRAVPHRRPGASAPIGDKSGRAGGKPAPKAIATMTSKTVAPAPKAAAAASKAGAPAKKAEVKPAAVPARTPKQAAPVKHAGRTGTR